VATVRIFEDGYIHCPIKNNPCEKCTPQIASNTPSDLMFYADSQNYDISIDINGSVTNDSYLKLQLMEVGES